MKNEKKKRSPDFSKTLFDSSNKDKRKTQKNYSDLFDREAEMQPNSMYLLKILNGFH